jgi:DNA-binding MarR family transcriptional regulator
MINFIKGVQTRKELSICEKYMLICIAAKLEAMNSKTVTMPFHEIQSEFDLSVSTIRANVERLKYKGYLIVYKHHFDDNGNAPNEYELTEKCYCTS